jgi:hypothetical protein
VLTQLTKGELAAAEPIFRWWREQGSPAPLLMAQEELARAADCFPIEFRDIRESHRVLAGRDPIEDVPIGGAYYRAQVEHELRAKFLRLRQKAAGMMSSETLLLRLLADSVGTFCVLFRHALQLAGVEAPTLKLETIARAAEAFGIDAAPFAALLDVREGRSKPGQIRGAELLEGYLAGISAVIDAVDRLDR